MKTATVWNEDKDLPSFFFPTAGHLAAQVSHPTQRIYHPRLKIGRKNVNAEAGGGGGNWVGADFPDALCFLFYVNCNVVRIFFIRRFPMFNK